MSTLNDIMRLPRTERPTAARLWLELEEKHLIATGQGTQLANAPSAPALPKGTGKHPFDLILNLPRPHRPNAVRQWLAQQGEAPLPEQAKAATTPPQPSAANPEYKTEQIAAVSTDQAQTSGPRSGQAGLGADFSRQIGILNTLTPKGFSRTDQASDSPSAYLRASGGRSGLITQNSKFKIAASAPSSGGPVVPDCRPSVARDHCFAPPAPISTTFHFLPSHLATASEASQPVTFSRQIGILNTLTPKGFSPTDHASDSPSAYLRASGGRSGLNIQNSKCNIRASEAPPALKIQNSKFKIAPQALPHPISHLPSPIFAAKPQSVAFIPKTAFSLQAGLSEHGYSDVTLPGRHPPSMKFWTPIFLTAATAMATALAASDRAGGPDTDAGANPDAIAFFDREVLPILETHCYECHGGEGEKIKGGLRLTSREGLLHGGDLGPAIDLEGERAKSLLLDMVRYLDEEHQMPPKGKLPEAEIATLTKWVEMGVPWNPEKEIHGGKIAEKSVVTEEALKAWAWKSVEEPAIPNTGDAQVIDRFIGQKLAEKGIEPNSRADRITLVRRAFYNLIGLPPTPEEVDAYLKDPRPDAEAWQALIDDLLARPQYGEKWARHWLDLVRYAETNGFERDNPKPEIWRYRDYVVDAFNADLPYDRFIIEQLAGDEIDQPTMQSLAATGFHRLMQWDDEPADRKQHVYDVLADNVQITTETFLGATLGCARCHDHKADPFTQKDFYSFMAFYAGITPYKTEGTIVPWAEPEEVAEFEKGRKQRLQAAQAQLATVETRMEDWLRSSGRLQKAGEDATSSALVADAREGKGAEWEYTLDKPTPDWKEVGFRNKSWIIARGGFGRAGTPGAVVKTDWATPDIWMRTTFGLMELPESLFLDIHHDEDVEVYLNGVLIHQATGFLTGYESVQLDQAALDALQTGRNVVAVHCRQMGGGQYIDLALRSGAGGAGDLNDALKRGGKDLARAIEKALGANLVGEREDLQKRVENIRKQRPGTPVNAVTEFGGEPEPMHVHIRGSAHAPGDMTPPAFPAVLTGKLEAQPAAIPAGYRRDQTSGRRRVLAEWIASPENPLTARVMMNRLWQHHFGRGIVPSTSDFGALGEAPTHPELLDWLGQEFIRQGWSLKAMHRLLMTSEAWQRSSAPSSAALEADPVNDLFWRYNMRRLTAEEVRDSILAISGDLSLKMSGPPVFPPLDEAVLATASRPDKAWPASNPEESARRSLYVHVKRSLRMPLLVDHDQADTDSHCAVRFTTTVPTQALGMLNSRFVNDQAAVLAARLEQEPGSSLEEKVRIALRLVTQQEPDDHEVRVALEMIARLKTEAGLDDRTALERFALLALNLNEFVYLD